MTDAQIVIMAGGIGQRLWPFSTPQLPKQFNCLLANNQSLLQQTVARYLSIVPPEKIWIVTHTSYDRLVKAQLPFIKSENILCEPSSHNTAPCIAYACQVLRKHFSVDTNIVIAPSDHQIKDQSVFKNFLLQALDFCSLQNHNAIVLLGAYCQQPATAYGYIGFTPDQNSLIKKVTYFIEKPTEQQAAIHIKAGDCLWNTGIFVGKLKKFIDQLQQTLPTVAYAFFDNPVVNVEEIYSQLPEEGISFDKAVLEKTKTLYVVPCDMGWSDLGSWPSIFEQSPKDECNNVLQGNIVTIDTKNCFIKSDTDYLVAALGIDDLIIVQHQQFILVGKQKEMGKIKKLLQQLQ